MEIALTSLSPDSNMTAIQTISLTFDLPFRHEQIPALRGAMAAFAGKENDLFHNHDLSRDNGNDHYRHRYPLIQYRVHEGKAAIFGINKGAEALDFLRKRKDLSTFSMNGYRHPLQVINSQREGSWQLGITPPDQMVRYRIYRYLPFHPENYRQYKSLFSLQDKIAFLERLLRNHLVSFFYGAGWNPETQPELTVVINDLDRVKKVKVMGINMMAFDLVFSVNSNLPEGIGIGRKTAFGFGWMISLENRK